MFFMAGHLDATHIKLSTVYICLTLLLVAKIFCDIDHVCNTDCDIASLNDLSDAISHDIASTNL